MSQRDFHKELMTGALGACATWCRFTVGATGAVGTLKQCKSNSISSVTRNSAGNYTVQFNEPYPAAMADVKVQLHRAGVTDVKVDVDYDAATYSNTTGQLVLFCSSNAGSGAAFATGTITCATQANTDDNDNVTIGDGVQAPKVYEFDKAGDGVTAGRVQVDISADTTAETVALRLKTAIEANQPLFTVTTNGAGVVTLTHKIAGTFANVTITEDVTHASFAVTGMSGGANAVVTPAAADPAQNAELHMQFIELRVASFDV